MIRNSGATERNPRIVDWSENVGHGDNMQFFADALGALAADSKENGGLMTIGLLGDGGCPGVTLRNAQAILRWDLHPSLWSHAFIVAAEMEPTPGAAAAAPIREISLYSRTGRGDPRRPFAGPRSETARPSTSGTARCGGTRRSRRSATR